MPIRFYDPRPPVWVPSPPHGAVTMLEPGATIGLLANGFPDSMAFLDALAGELALLRPQLTFSRVEKQSPPTPLTAEQLHMLVHECDAVIAAYGH